MSIISLIKLKISEGMSFKIKLFTKTEFSPAINPLAPEFSRLRKE